MSSRESEPSGVTSQPGSGGSDSSSHPFASSALGYSEIILGIESTIRAGGSHRNILIPALDFERHAPRIATAAILVQQTVTYEQLQRRANGCILGEPPSLDRATYRTHVGLGSFLLTAPEHLDSGDGCCCSNHCHDCNDEHHFDQCDTALELVNHSASRWFQRALAIGENWFSVHGCRQSQTPCRVGIERIDTLACRDIDRLTLATKTVSVILSGWHLERLSAVVCACSQPMVARSTRCT